MLARVDAGEPAARPGSPVLDGGLHLLPSAPCPFQPGDDGLRRSWPKGRRGSRFRRERVSTGCNSLASMLSGIESRERSPVWSRLSPLRRQQRLASRQQPARGTPRHCPVLPRTQSWILPPTFFAAFVNWITPALHGVGPRCSSPGGASRFQCPGLARSLALYCADGLVF